jgi:uncharacterized membrane protein YgdD (TMEM256/DUF423 family)
MHKALMFTGAVLTALAIMMGAFGAHALKGHLSEEMLTVYKTAVEYHIYHALGMLLVGILWKQYPTATLITWSGGMMMLGILLFCGSLYILSITGTRWLGAITPFGGVAFIVAWLLLAIDLWRLG